MYWTVFAFETMLFKIIDRQYSSFAGASQFVILAIVHKASRACGTAPCITGKFLREWCSFPWSPRVGEDLGHSVRDAFSRHSNRKRRDP
jgi:hypothetical protein